MIEKFKEYQTKANIYYAYHTIQRYTDEPFTRYRNIDLPFTQPRYFSQMNILIY